MFKRIFKKLAFQFGVVMAFIASFPLILASINLIGINRTAVESSTMELFSSTAKMAALEVDYYVKSKKESAKRFAASLDVSTGIIRYETVNKLEESFVRDTSLIAAVTYDGTGVEILKLTRSEKPVRRIRAISKELGFNEALNGRTWTEFNRNKTLELVTYAPTAGSGVFVTINDASELEEVFDGHRFGRSGATCFIDGYGQGLYKPAYDDLPYDLTEYSNENQIKEFVQTRSFGTSEGKLDDGREVLVAFAPTANYNGGVIVHQLYDDAYYSSIALRRNSVVGVIAGTFLAIIIAVIFSNYLTNPLRRLADASRQLAKGDFNVNVKSRRTDEVGDLIGTFNDTIRSLREKIIIESAMRRYLSQDMAEYIIERPEMLRLGGEERIISIMFTDIRGFVSFAEDMNPEALVSFLNYQHDVVTKIVFKYHGTLDKFVGDGVIALFGAPIELDDYQYLALAAALDIQANVKTDEKLKPMGISITTGPVVIGNMGSLERMEYTAVGQPMNLASRLQEYAGPGEVLIDSVTYENMTGRVTADGPYTEVIRGFKDPVLYHRVKGLKDNRDED